jgi:hypothetical protein
VTGGGAGAVPLAGRLTALADWMEQRLDDEDYDRQAVAESALTQLRELAALARKPVPAPAMTLTPAQLATVLTALADAETYRMREAAGFCGTCETHPAGACEDHLDDVDAAQAYSDLAGELEGGAE